jgi:hypothetical protein
MKMQAVSKNLLKSRFADPLAKMDTVARIAGKFMFEKHPAAKVLEVNIYFIDIQLDDGLIRSD